MNILVIVLIISSMIAVVASLFAGIYVMAKGQEINKKYSNRLMRARVFLQGLAIGLLLIAYLMWKQG